FFEQSGTFKREFIRLGIRAEDYDILNEFGETDHIVDLFGEIDLAFKGGAVRIRCDRSGRVNIRVFSLRIFCSKQYGHTPGRSVPTEESNRPGQTHNINETSRKIGPDVSIN
ncbi:MAG: hypothetical protein IKP68_12565, partial [Clostridia bacterium]|nr:hypothetical protein [Clostridia bacterium]